MDPNKGVPTPPKPSEVNLKALNPKSPKALKGERTQSPLIDHKP